MQIKSSIYIIIYVKTFVHYNIIGSGPHLTVLLCCWMHNTFFDYEIFYNIKEIS